MSIIKSIKGVFATKVLILAFNLLNSVLLARILGVEGRGEFAIFYSAATIISSFFSFGIPTANGFFVPKSNYYIKIIARKAGVLYFVVIFFILLPILIFIDSISFWLLPEKLHYSQNTILLVILVFTMMFSNLFLSFYIATLRFKISNVFRFSSVLVLTVLYVFLFTFVSQISTKNFLLWFVVSQIFIFLVLFILFYAQYRKIIHNEIPKEESLERFSNILKWGGVAWVSNVLQLLTFRVDFWFVDSFLNSHDLGIYSLAASLAQLLWFLPQSVTAVLYPYISKGTTNTKMITKWVVSVRVTFYIILIAAIIAVLVSPFLIPILYGQDFAASAPILNLLLIGTVPFCITLVLFVILSGNNRVDLCLWASAIGLFFTVVLDFILIPKYGIMGAVFTSIISYWATTIFIIIVFKNKFKIPLSELFILKRDDINLFINQLNIRR